MPAALRGWFVVHFVADWAFALPLFFAPRWFLGLLGWTEVDPVSARIVAAALIGIGTQSLLSRHGSLDTYRALLNLKVLWSASAAAGLAWSALDGAPPMTWGLFGVFAVFNAVWFYWLRRLSA